MNLSVVRAALRTHSTHKRRRWATSNSCMYHFVSLLFVFGVLARRMACRRNITFSHAVHMQSQRTGYHTENENESCIGIRFTINAPLRQICECVRSVPKSLSHQIYSSRLFEKALSRCGILFSTLNHSSRNLLEYNILRNIFSIANQFLFFFRRT